VTTSAAQFDAATVPERIEHVTALDGLRGLAVLLVVVYHLSVSPTAGPVAGLLPGGFIGVDVFFVLSGFLITSLLVIDRTHRGRTITGRFWIRRARRLLPALLAAVLLGALVTVLIAEPWQLQSMRNMGLASLLYVSNWYAVFGHPITNPLSHTWSLAIEEQWYVVWPFLLAGLLALTRLRRSLLLAAIVGLAAISFVLMGVFFSADGWVRAYYSTDTRAWELLAGAGLAVVVIGREPLRSRSARIAAEVLGVAALVGLIWVSRSATPFDGGMYPWGFGLAVLAAGALVVAVLQPASPAVAPVLRARWFVGLGLISYGLYLYHVPVFQWLSPDVVGLKGWPLVLLRVGVSLALAVVSYRFLEMPIRRGALGAGQMRWLAPASAVAVVGVIVVVTLGGRPQSIVERSGAYYGTAASNLRPGTARIAVFGDGDTLALGSHGVYGAPGVRGIAVPLVFCSVFSGAVVVGTAASTPRRCPPWRPLFSSAVDHFDPDLAVIASGRSTMFDRQADGVTLRAGSDGLRRLLMTDLEHVRSTVTAQGARLLVLGVTCAPTGPTEPATIAGIAHDETRRAWVNGVLRDFAQRHSDTATYVDADRLTCPTSGVWPTVGGAAVRTTDGTLTPAGARALWNLIGTQAAEQKLVRQ
jgi:peptidoglycan/LPS O-acetylase OafA/YrhL